MMSKVKPYKEQETVSLSAAEPVAAYGTNVANAAEREIPDYVWEDVRIGLEQYERGEYSDAWDFLKTLKR